MSMVNRGMTPCNSNVDNKSKNIEEKPGDNFNSISNNQSSENMTYNQSSVDGYIQSDEGGDPLQSQQQIEEERLRCDILKYLVSGNNSNGVYNYTASLHDIIHDVVEIPANTTTLDYQETVQSLLDILHSDPQKRFLMSGEGDNIIVKRCFVRGDEEEISDLVEEWRTVIAKFLMDSKRSVGLSDIGSRY